MLAQPTLPGQLLTAETPPLLLHHSQSFLFSPVMITSLLFSTMMKTVFLLQILFLASYA